MHAWVAGHRFIRLGVVATVAAVGLQIGGIPAAHAATIVGKACQPIASGVQTCEWLAYYKGSDGFDQVEAWGGINSTNTSYELRITQVKTQEKQLSGAWVDIASTNTGYWAQGSGYISWYNHYITCAWQELDYRSVVYFAYWEPKPVSQWFYYTGVSQPYDFYPNCIQIA